MSLIENRKKKSYLYNMCIQSWLRVKQHKGLIVFIIFELVKNKTLSLICIIMTCLTIIIAFMLFQIFLLTHYFWLSFFDVEAQY